MSRLRFQHVFAALMLLAALSAFVLPPRLTSRAHPEIQGLFAPIAWPVRAVAERVMARVNPPGAADARSKEAIFKENEELRQVNVTLQSELSQLREAMNLWDKLGSLKERCTPFAVVGGDAGARDSLLLRGSSVEGLRDGMFVIHPGGVVGVIGRVGWLGGAQTQLVTDRNFVVRGAFANYGRDDAGKLGLRRLRLPAVLVNGLGNGEMLVQRVVRDDAVQAGVAAGTWLVVNDPDWPAELRDQRLGVVVDMTTRRDSALHVDVRVRPPSDLRQLRWVMVMNK